MGFIYKQKKVRTHKRKTPKSKKTITIDSYNRNQRYRTYANIPKSKAQELFDQRPSRSKNMDLKSTSKNLLETPNEYWVEHMNRSDVKGIDTKKVKTDEKVQDLIKSYALGRDSPLSNYQFDHSAIGKVFPSYQDYIEDWTWHKLGIKKDEIPFRGISRKHCERCGKFMDKRLMTEGKCPKCYWEHLHAVAHMGADYSQYIDEARVIRKQLNDYLRKHLEKGTKKPKLDSDIYAGLDPNDRLYEAKKRARDEFQRLKNEKEKFAEYYNKIIEKNEKPLQKKLKSLEEEIKELERKGDRNSRFDIVLRYPQGEQKELVEKYNKLLKKYTKLHSRDFELKLQNTWKKIQEPKKSSGKKKQKATEDKYTGTYAERLDKASKERAKLDKEIKISDLPKSFLPGLHSDQKYILAYVDEHGYAHYISWTKDPQKAMKNLTIERTISKKLDIKKKVELFVAKDIEDVRKKLYAQNRESYLITGDTFKNRKEIHKIGKLSFDYNEKGYRGKLSKEEIEKLKNVPGLKIKKFRDITEEDKQASEEAKAHSKTKKHLKHIRKSGSIWQKDNPFSKEQNALNESLTWLFNLSGDQDRLNSDFKSYVNNKEKDIVQRLGIDRIEDAPEDVQNAYDRYRKEVYTKILADLRGKQVAPSMAITGPSKYKGNFDKRERIEKRAREKFKNIDKVLNSTVNRYANLTPKKTAEEKREEYRQTITPKLIEAKAKGKKVYSQLYGKWFEIKKVNQKSITVHSELQGDFTLDKHFIDSIES